MKTTTQHEDTVYLQELLYLAIEENEKSLVLELLE